MGYNNSTNNYEADPGESSQNIQYQWANEIARMLSAINFYNNLVEEGHYENVSRMFSYIVTLTDYVVANIDVGEVKGSGNKVIDRGIDVRIKEIRRKIPMFEKRLCHLGVVNDMMRIRMGQTIHQELRELYRVLMNELKHHGILQYLKMDLKTLARQNWYGDA